MPASPVNRTSKSSPTAEIFAIGIGVSFDPETIPEPVIRRSRLPRLGPCR